MTYEEARVIYHAWRVYMEVAGKLRLLKLTPPETFLPYPAKTLETALNMMSGYYVREGGEGFDTAVGIKESISDYLAPYLGATPLTDRDALEGMSKSLTAMLDDEQLRYDLLLELARAQQKWIAHRHPPTSS